MNHFSKTRARLPALLLGAVTVFSASLMGQKVSLMYYLDGQQSTVNNLGYTVTGVGDINKDGHDDFAGGAPGWDAKPSSGTMGSNEGRAFIYSGKNGTTLMVFDGENPGDGFGQDMAGAGDVNKDGYPDVTVSAPGWDDTKNKITDAGRVYVISGLWIALKAGTKFIYTFTGAQGQSSQYGLAVANAGDVNLDTYPDIIVGEPWWSIKAGTSTREGRAYVFSGKDGKLLYTHTGATKGERLGEALAGLGDVNKDAFGDYAVGSPGYNDTVTSTSGVGRAFVFSGRTGKSIRTFTGKGAFENLGGSLSGIADVNNDKVRDIVVASATFSKGTFTFDGKVTVYSGFDGKLLRSWIGPAQSMSGISVAAIDDITGDGLQDILVGAFRYDVIPTSRNNDTGRVNVLSGKDASLYATIDGERTADWFGYRVAAVGDADKDGVPDFIAAARLWDLDPTQTSPQKLQNGRLYVYSGTKLSLTADQHLHSLSSTGTGTTQKFRLSAGTTHANRSYVLATSLGTGPIPVGAVLVPLSADLWFNQTLGMILTRHAFFPNWVGKLDAKGDAAASWTLPPNKDTSLIGTTLWQAYVVWHRSGTLDLFDMASNAVPMTLIQ
ncbi:MAG: hypothetical protein ACYST0_11875 [Planctomycetota bacterium]